MRPTIRKEAREWLSLWLAKKIKFVNEKEGLKCSVLLVEEGENEEYYSKINEYITTSFNESQSMQVNDFGIKYKDFAEAVKGIQGAKEDEKKEKSRETRNKITNRK